MDLKDKKERKNNKENKGFNELKSVLRRKNTKTLNNKSYEETNKINKLILLFIIVNQGQGETIQNLLTKYKVSSSYAFHGVGTAKKEYYLQDFNINKKTIIISVVSLDEYNLIIKNELIKRFSISRYAKGIFFTIDLKSIVGVSVYKYFTKTDFVKEKEFKKHE